MFMLQGHTKFTPDGAFGLIKHCYRSHVGVHTVPEVADAVDKSSLGNVPILDETVKWTDCNTYLS